MSGISVIGIAFIFTACSDSTGSSSKKKYVQTDLVADVAGLGASTLDPNLVNPWGLAFGPTGILWVANNHTGTSTLYDADGTVHTTVVTIPTSGGGPGGAPTGIIYNATSDFIIPGAGAALFIFVGEDGVVSAWNATTGNARVVADRSANDAVYKGVTIASNGGTNFLYATNFKKNLIDVFDGTFHFTTSFTDPNIPAGYAPFGIQNINGKLYVTFAKQHPPDNEDDEAGVGNGYVDVFNADGTLSMRFASNGTLNAPWGVALAPAGFGDFGGDILIGNFGDGLIGAYNPANGHFDGLLQTPNNGSVTIDGLWGLTFGPTAGSTTLYFAAGSGDEIHGLLGTLTPQ